MKYRNKKTMLDGEVFDSRREAQRWAELCIMQKAGEITDLRRQVRFPLLPSQKGRTRWERPVYYIADFVYTMDGAQIIEDAKGVKTRDYILKRKMMMYFHGVEVKEV